MKYKLYKRKKRLNGNVTYSKQKPYIFNPAYRRNKNIIDINKLVIYNSKMIDNILQKKYIRRYKNLLKMVYLLFNDAFPGETGYPAVLDETSKLRSIILDKYYQYLSLAKSKQFLKELDYIEKEVQMKFIEHRIFESQVMQFNGVNR